MKPWKALLCGLGLSGLILFGAVGCGGSDVPDAGSDMGDSAPPEPSMPAPPPVQDQAAAAAPAAPGGPGAPAAAEPGAAGAPTPAEPAAAKGDANSATAEMLALATAPPPASAAPTPEPEGAAPGAPGGPGGPGMSGGQLFPPGGPGGPGSSGGQLFPPGSGGERDPSLLAAPGSSGAMAGSSALQPGASGLMPPGSGQLAPGGGSGGGGSGSGGAQSSDPGDTTSPDGAVKAFLHALETRDRDRLAEATALRAVSELEGGSHRELFSRIFDNSISDAELDELATALDGFEVSGFNQVKSTGRLGVTVRKKEEEGGSGGWLQRTITVRKEKKGWGVLDISAQSRFHGGPRGRTTGGARR